MSSSLPIPVPVGTPFTIHVQMFQLRSTTSESRSPVEIRTVRDSRIPSKLFIVMPTDVVECKSDSNSLIELQNVAPRLSLTCQGQAYDLGDFTISILTQKQDLLISIDYMPCLLTNIRKPILELMNQINFDKPPVILPVLPYKLFKLDQEYSDRHRALDIAHILIPSSQ